MINRYKTIYTMIMNINRITNYSLAVFLFTFFMSCSSGQKTEPQQEGLKDYFKGRFLIGTALNDDTNYGERHPGT